MTNENNNWENELHRRLRDLPDLEAPESLIPNVMAAVAARSRPVWYRRPASTWPGALQAGFAAGAVVMLALLVFFGRDTLADLHSVALWRDASTWQAQFSSFWNTARILVGAFGAVLQSISVWVYIVIAAACAGYLALIAAGSAVWHRLILQTPEP